ncbi:MAG: ribonuclease III [Anaerovoracaceae bacterium]
MNKQEFSDIIGYQFHDTSLLDNALTHSSYYYEARQGTIQNNERLEFLGDSIFNAVISKHLYDRVKYVEEGSLTKLRALVVCERSLAECGNRLRIGKYLKLGRGEENSGGRMRSSIIADAVEAVIGAIYIDGGFNAAGNFIIRAFKSTIDRAIEGKLHWDFKTEIQERLQANGTVDILYHLDREEGPDHNKTFYVSLFVDNNKIGEGQGRTKKEAEQNAAKAALEGTSCILKE